MAMNKQQNRQKPFRPYVIIITLGINRQRASKNMSAERGEVFGLFLWLYIIGRYLIEDH